MVCSCNNNSNDMSKVRDDVTVVVESGDCVTPTNHKANPQDDLELLAKLEEANRYSLTLLKVLMLLSLQPIYLV